MTTFLIFIILMICFYIIRNLVRQNNYNNMHNDVMAEIRKENPNYDKELKEALEEAQECQRRQQLYLAAMKKKGYDVSFGWQSLCNDNLSWKTLEPDLKRMLKE